MMFGLCLSRLSFWQVKLSQYRSAGGGGGGGELGGDQEQDKIARALLSNTDKEVIFDGIKKLYRKKAS